MARMPSLSIRRAAERGLSSHGSLSSAHTFGVGGTIDEQRGPFAALRVLDEDLVAPGEGVPPHSHRNVDIISYVLDGSLEHRDSLGNNSIVQSGGVQYLSAGSGVTHSMFNPSDTKPVRFLQIWLLPVRAQTVPRYATMTIDPFDKRGRLSLFLSPDGRYGSMATEAPALVYAGSIDGRESVRHELAVAQKAWLQVMRGRVALNGHGLAAGDGAALDGAGMIHLDQGSHAEVMLVVMR